MEKLKISPLIYVSLLGFSFAFLITSWIDYNLQKKTPLIIPSINQTYHYKKTQINYYEILKRDIFGIKKENTIVTHYVKVPQNFEQKSIQGLKLLGLLKGKNDSYALILWHGKFFVLKKGENLNGLELISIGFNKASFRYGGRIYTFKLNESNGNPSINTSEMTQNLLIANNMNKSNSKEIYKTVISKQEILSRMGDINQVISSALFQPFYLNNKLLGYRIRFIRPGALLFRLGLRPGDIITLKGKSKNLEVVSNSIGGSSNVSNFGWLEFNTDQRMGKFLAYPEVDKIPENINAQLIVELYSK